jgi:hypothetical protein
MPKSSPSRSRTVLHVVFHDAWRIKEENQELLPRLFASKEEAIEHARKLAKAAPLAQVIIHKQNHEIETEYTYGADPRDTPG